LKEFSTKPIFDPSLFVEIRKRVGANTFDALNKNRIQSISKEEDKKQQKGDELPQKKGSPQLEASFFDQ